MIRFACRCSHVLELPDDMAGLSAQCPKCGLLLDAPTLSDANAIDKDGTYRLDDKPKPKADTHLKELTTVYFPGRQLSDGTEIDLRGPVQPLEPSLPPDSDSSIPLPADRPKYDPETGELIVPIDINQPKTPVPLSEIPTAKRVISYTTSAVDTPMQLLGLGVFARLCQPVNLIVLGVMFLMHMSLVLFTLISNYVIFIIVAPVLLFVVLVGHYAMLVEEMGPTDRDELPRPLRNVHPYDDFLAPFMHMATALLLCYWPSLLIIMVNWIAWSRGQAFPFPRTRELHLGLFLLGSLFFPAVLQTICTSGNIVNLRPDRLLGVIRSTGLHYLPLVILWMLAGCACMVGQVAVLLNWVMNVSSTPNPPLIATSYVAYPLLMAGIYLMHAFGWILGLEYRRAPYALSLGPPATHPRARTCPTSCTAPEALRCRASRPAASRQTGKVPGTIDPIFPRLGFPIPPATMSFERDKA